MGPRLLMGLAGDLSEAPGPDRLRAGLRVSDCACACAHVAACVRARASRSCLHERRAHAAFAASMQLPRVFNTIPD